MANVVGYHRPASMDDALALLAAPSPKRLVLAGGTVVNTDRSPEPVEVVDVQALGLSGIALDGDRLRIGAATTLALLSTDESTPGLIAELASRELPSTLRTLATVGGLVACADPESELLAALLVYVAKVTIVSTSGEAEVDLADVLDSGPGSGIISAVSIETGGVTAASRTGRTPGDSPIVAAVARRGPDGFVRLAASGVAGRPVLVQDHEALDPPGDFRGSSTYRRHLASVLAGRVLTEVG